MCGIFGAISLRATIEDFKMFANTFHETKSRGRDSSGLYLVGNNSRVEQIGERLDADWIDQPIRLIGNNRAMPTTEWVDKQDPRNIQPFQSPSKRWLFTHNGTISNDRELLAKFGHSIADYPTTVDSYAIGVVLDAIGRRGNDSSHQIFVEAIRQLEGSFAILAIDVTSPITRGIHFATNYKPLYMLRDPHNYSSVQVASLKKHLMRDSQTEMRLGYAPVAIPQYTMGCITTEGAFVSHDLYPRETHTKKVLAICSGGLDSTVVAWKYHMQGLPVELLHFLYDCKAQAREVEAVEAIAKRMGTKAHFIEVDFFKKHAQSVLTDPNQTINTSDGGERGAEYAHEWVPARNTVMLALATAFAEANNFRILTLGNNLEESGGGFPDNEEEFINRWEALLPYAVKPGHELWITQPVGALVKHEIVKLGLDLRAPLDLTWSCYAGGEKPCTVCGPCYLRQKAFLMNGMVDPLWTRYGIDHVATGESIHGSI